MRRNLRKVGVIVTITVFLLILTGGSWCVAKETLVKRFAGTELNFFALAQVATEFVKDEILPTFEKETGIKVRMDFFAWKEATEKHTIEIAAGERYDIYSISPSWIGVDAKAGYLEPLDDYIKKYAVDMDNYFPHARAFATVDGKVYGIPYHDNPVAFWYRKDLLKAAGMPVPDTWYEVLDTAKKLTKDTNGDGKIDQWGFVIRGETAGGGICWTWFPMLWSFGGDLFDENWKPTINSSEAIESVKLYKDLFKYSPPGFLSMWEVSKAMTTGRGAMATLMAGHVFACDDPKQSQVVGLVNIANMPRYRERSSITMTTMVGIAATSRRKEAAFQLLRYIADPINVERGGLPFKWCPAMPFVYDLPGGNRWMKDIKGCLEVAHPGPTFPELYHWYDIVGNELQRVVLGEKDAKTAMDDAAAEVYEVMKKAGYYK